MKLRKFLFMVCLVIFIIRLDNEFVFVKFVLFSFETAFNKAYFDVTSGVSGKYVLNTGTSTNSKFSFTNDNVNLVSTINLVSCK